ncbi:hypothetical protein EST38_g6287 [Candolleomyces aberdarensis]|uniref:Uncharacterized protein n=1 Tax=Candolleomyces aberdarensis TaxID=2316362 RepID=A0A4Q2DK39_9AGAR|nr:hypothetical protein EST38_g6287 [Candolleomyces aberdarensis]
MAEARRNVNVAIIGAGAAGIAFAIALKKQHGFKNFVIYDKGSEVGGTWRDNIYPVRRYFMPSRALTNATDLKGCSSDVPMVLYSLSSETKYDWPQSHGSQEEIFEYWKEVARKNNLYSHISFNHLVSSAKWNSDLTLYEIGVTNTITGEHLQRTANILVSAVGVLENPRFADIPGVGTFKGDIFHSARWDKSVDLRGKRVAVIGNGSSAAQFVPKITNDPSVYVVNFVRSPGWLWRPVCDGWILSFEARKLRHGDRFESSIRPSEAMGCKRLIFDTGYLEAMHRPNLKMNFDGIESIVEDGIVTKKNGEHIPFDVMIFATGYAAVSFI